MVQPQRAAATRAQIVRGAAEMFDKSGFEGASLVEITEAAGMTKGALYFHFHSQEELARHIIAEQHRISIAAVEAIAAQEASALEQIVMLCHEKGYRHHRGATGVATPTFGRGTHFHGAGEHPEDVDVRVRGR